jgi:hypothetical protein
MSAINSGSSVEEIKQRVELQDRKVSVSLWGREHGVCTWLLPLRHRRYDPLAVAEHIRDEVVDMYEFQERFTREKIGIDEMNTEITDPLLRMFQVTVVDGDAEPTQFYNPNYTHYDTVFEPIKDADQRAVFIEKFVESGAVSPSWFADHFGIETVDWWVRRHGYEPIKQQLKRSRDMIGRSIYTVSDWTDRSVAGIADILCFDYTNVRSWIRRGVSDQNWQPPDRPVGKSDFAFNKSPESYVEQTPPWWERPPSEREI